MFSRMFSVPVLTLGLIATAMPAFSATLRVAHNLGYGGRESVDPISPVRFFPINQMLYDPLVWPDNNGKPSPALATSWFNSPDFRTWTFTIRKDVRFHNGDAMTARDVAFSLQRVLSPKLASPVRSVLSFIEDVKVIDASTVAVHLKQPHADFPIVLMDYRVRVVSAKSLADNTDAIYDSGIGTGPFKLQNLDPEGTTVLVANLDYWGGKPGVDEVDVIAIPDTDARNQALLAGQIDMSEVTGTEERLFGGTSNFVVQKIPAGAWNPIVMRTDTPPFNDPRVRKALKLLADRKALLRSVLGEENGIVACDEPVWPGDPYFDAEIKCEPDLPMAKKLLSEAGFADGLTLDLYTSSVEPSMIPLAEAYQAQAAQAGVNINVRVVPADGYWTNIWLKPNYPFVVGNWGQRPADQVLNEVFRSNAKWNESAWNRPDFDSLLDEARKSGSFDERKAVYGKAQKVLSEEGGAFVPFFKYETRVYSLDVTHVDAVPDILMRWQNIAKQ
ncbi:ABC transporter substrate-binding protein [Sinorhizobium terangae]|uniref:ABC transporter substrate-binding protein n=1 Tax=Sinorhizobium terangae TaxID=110322 RepID=UPI0024B080DE|nr:ABC transporter substrate-binding protein [Sinorhizobium terangae]WFU51748.1 ABC transporter substrate-binding protein [Sinorhizobium terangae]